MQKSVILPVIDQDSELKFRYLPLTALLSIMWIIICVVGGWIGIPIMIGFGIGFLALMVMQVIPGYSVKGEAEFSAEKIVIRLEKEIVFPIDEIGGLRFKYYSYKGQPGRNFSEHGTDNFIEFRHGGKEYHYELLLQRHDLSLLDQLFDSWKTKDISFDLVGRMGFSVRSIS